MQTKTPNPSNGTSTKKRRRRSIIAFEMVQLDRTASEPLHLQLYRQIRDELESGSFDRNSSRLPSSRALAIDLGISRLTVNLALAKLHAEGYLRARQGSGTFVVDLLPRTFLSAQRSSAAKREQHRPRVARRTIEMLDQRSSEDLDVGVAGSAGLTLVPGLPAVDEFPMGVWERLRGQVLAKKGSNLLRYASSRGDLDLRKALAAYLCDFRGAHCHAGQIIIVSGMQQAILICTMALVNSGETVWMEDPGFHQARASFSFAGAKVVPRAVDREGITLAPVQERHAPRLIYVTPSHQWPLGITMSVERRTALLDFARAHDALVLEDDYNSEFRFDGPPLPCLQGLDDSGRVIYAGTMSKILYPSLRIGYLIAPDQIVDSLVRVRSVIDLQSPSIDQATLARFITEGFFLSHIKRMRTIYADRRNYFIEQFGKLLGTHFILEVTPAGLHSVARLRRKEDWSLFLRVREETGVTPSRLSFFSMQTELAPAFVFGFAAWTRAQIKESLIKFASGFERLRSRDAA